MIIKIKKRCFDHLATLALLFGLCCAMLVVSPGALSETVNIYTERQLVFLQPILDKFTEATGIDTEVLYLDKGAVERLRNEGANSLADVIIVTDAGRLTKLAEEKLSEPIDNKVVIDSVPAWLRAPDSRWVALTKRHRVLFVARDAQLKINSYEQLSLSSWHGNICLRSGLHPYNINLIAAYIYHHGINQARTWLTGLKNNLARSPQGNDRAQLKGVASGECKVAIANLYYYYKMLNSDDPAEREVAEKVRWIAPQLAGRGVHTNLSGIALAKHAPHRASALALIEYMVGSEAQRLYAFANYELPVRPDTPLPAALQPAFGLIEDKISVFDIAAWREAASDLVYEVDFDG